MTTVQIASVVVLVIAFAVAIWRHVNVGLVTLPAAGLVLLFAPVGVDDYFTAFPGSLVVLILGVSYLFRLVQGTGAVDRLVAAAERATGNRDWLLPWIMFLAAGLLSAIGALPAASLAIVVPIAMRAAQVRDINPVLMGLVTISGALAGGFSPISVWGQLVAQLAHGSGRPLSAPALFVVELVLNTLVGLVAFVVFGGLRLVRRPVTTGAASAGAEPEPGSEGTVTGTGRQQLLAAAGVLVFVVLVLAFSLDVGLTAFAVGLVLHLVLRPDEAEVLRGLPWSVVLVISGVLLYVGLLEQVGTFDAVAKHLGGIDSFALAVLALAYVGSLFASFESSSVAVLGIVIPVTLRVATGLDDVQLLMVLSLVSWAIVTISPNPYHLSGGLVLASSPEEQRPALFRQLLVWAFSVAVVLPLLGWWLPLVV